MNNSDLDKIKESDLIFLLSKKYEDYKMLFQHTYYEETADNILKFRNANVDIYLENYDNIPNIGEKIYIEKIDLHTDTNIADVEYIDWDDLKHHKMQMHFPDNFTRCFIFSQRLLKLYDLRRGILTMNCDTAIHPNYRSIVKLFDIKVINDLVLKPKQVQKNEDGSIIVLQNNNYGLFDGNYTTIIPSIYDKITPIIENNHISYFEVQKNGLKGLYSCKYYHYKKLLDCKYQDYKVLKEQPYIEGFFTKENYLWGFEGSLMIEHNYESLSYLGNDDYKDENNEWHFINFFKGKKKKNSV